MKLRDPELSKGWVQIVHTLSINTEGIFRIIQSIPSSKAGGDIAGGARKKLEKRLGRSIVTNKKFLPTKTKKLTKISML